MTEATVTRHSDGGHSLYNFQTVVQQQEGIIGPLVAIKREGENNAITLKDGKAPPNRSILEIYSTPEPPLKNGHNHVCNGICLVEGKETKVAAYRKK